MQQATILRQTTVGGPSWTLPSSSPALPVPGHVHSALAGFRVGDACRVTSHSPATGLPGYACYAVTPCLTSKQGHPSCISLENDTTDSTRGV